MLKKEMFLAVLTIVFFNLFTLTPLANAADCNRSRQGQLDYRIGVNDGVGFQSKLSYAPFGTTVEIPFSDKYNVEMIGQIHGCYYADGVITREVTPEEKEGVVEISSDDERYWKLINKDSEGLRTKLVLQKEWVTVAAYWKWQEDGPVVLQATLDLGTRKLTAWAGYKPLDHKKLKIKVEEKILMVAHEGQIIYEVGLDGLRPTWQRDATPGVSGLRAIRSGLNETTIIQKHSDGSLRRIFTLDAATLKP